MAKEKKLTDIVILENPKKQIFVYGMYGKGKKAPVIVFGGGSTKAEAIADARSGKYKDKVDWYEAFYSEKLDNKEVGKSGNHKPVEKKATGGAVEKPKPVSYTEDEKRKGLYTVLFSDGEKQVVDFTLPDLAELRKQSEIFAFADKNYKANRNEFKEGGEVDKQYSVEVHFNPADANYFIGVLENILGVKITDASMFDVSDSMITIYGLTKKEEENLFGQLSADSKVLNCDSQEMIAGGGKVDKQVERVAPEQLATGGEIKGDEDCWCFPLLYY